jgi:hypothetical protein
MARSLRCILLGICVVAFAATLPFVVAPAVAAEMDKNAKSDAKTAMRLYKEGNYEDAAKIFVKLSVAYPDMLVFVRNLGACYYYLRRYEPALSNLRDYEHRKKDMAPDDRAEVAGWIGEMERVRDQAAAVAAPPPTAPPPAAIPVPPVAPVPIVVPVPTPPAPEEAASAAPTPPPAEATPAAAPPAQPVENAYSPQQGQYGAQPNYPQGQNGAPAQPAYPPQGQYGAQPAYPPQGQYGAQPTYPNTQYPPAGGAYPPAYQPGAYPQGGYANAGVATPANPPPSSGGGRKAVAWILGIAGVGSVVAGGYFTATALDRFSKVQTKYDPALEKQGKDDAKYQWICYGAGGALLTTAIIVGATGQSSPPSVALSPAVGPGVAGATLSGSF